MGITPSHPRIFMLTILGPDPAILGPDLDVLEVGCSLPSLPTVDLGLLGEAHSALCPPTLTELSLVQFCMWPPLLMLLLSLQ